MTAVARNPRKGLYDNSKPNTYKAFNTIEQTQSGLNSIYQLDQSHGDPKCAERFVYVSLTSLKDNLNMNIEFAIKSFHVTDGAPELGGTSAGASSSSAPAPAAAPAPA